MSRRDQGFAGPLRSLLILGSTSGLTDGQLLDRFATAEASVSALAFEALIDRHGPMVLRVCRSVVRDPHDAQDAFQATFLVLVKKARSIRDRDSMASWLHGVALRVARHARTVEARRRRLDRVAVVARSTWAEVPEPDEVGSKVHEAVDRLPERYRSPVVLCYLEGKSCDEAATLLGWPVGTVKSRLSRARDRLRGQLTRLGLAPESMVEGGHSPIPPRLTRETAEVAARFEKGDRIEGPAFAALILAKGVLKTMTLSTWKIPAMALMVATTWMGVTRALTPVPPVQEPPKAQKPPEPALAEAPKPKAEEWFQIAPAQLKVASGSGTARLFALDANGERMIDPAAVPKIPADQGPFKEVTKDLQWVVITGTLDNQAIREGLSRKRKIPLEFAYANYKRLDVQRQVRLTDGVWSEWKETEQEKNWKILDNLTELAKEVTPECFRPSALVDPLPILQKGTWSGVDHEVILRLPDPGPAVVPGPRPAVVPAPGPANDLRMPGSGSAPPRAAVAGPPFEVPSFWQSESMILAVRSLDFTVESGRTYRYRVRVVYFNPEFGQPGQDQKNLSGEWSEPTAEVKVP